MSEALQFGLGVALSLLLFAISYRQTIGARKERARSANAELERTLRKRLLLENSMPTVVGLGRFVEGTARSHRVRVSDLLAEDELLNVLFSRVFEDDLLSPEARTEALRAIEELAKRVEDTADEPRQSSSDRVRFRSVVIMTISAALAGSLAAIVPLAGDSSEEPSSVFLATLAASLALVTALATVLRYRDRLEASTSDDSPLQEAARLEREVRKAIESAGPTVMQPMPRGPIDFVVQMDGGPRIGIEAKLWRSSLPKPALARSLKLIGERARRAEVDRVWVVTPNADELPLSDYEGGFVELMTPSELSARLKKS